MASSSTAGDDAATRASFAAVTGDVGQFDAWQRFHAGVRRLARGVFPTLLDPLRSRAELRRIVGDDAAWEALVQTPLARHASRLRWPTISCAGSCSPTG